MSTERWRVLYAFVIVQDNKQQQQRALIVLQARECPVESSVPRGVSEQISIDQSIAVGRRDGDAYKRDKRFRHISELELFKPLEDCDLLGFRS